MSRIGYFVLTNYFLTAIIVVMNTSDVELVQRLISDVKAAPAMDTYLRNVSRKFDENSLPQDGPASDL